MGLIARPTKEGGATTYAGKVAAGFSTILDQEFDDDFGVIFAVINGNLDANNLANNAVTTAKLANGAVTDAKVAGGADINASKLLNASIAKQKLQPGASIWTRNEAAAFPNVPFGSTEGVGASTTITPRSSVVTATVSASGYLSTAADGQLRLFSILLYRNGVALALMPQQVSLPAGTPGGMNLPWSGSFRFTDVTATAGAVNTYEVRVIGNTQLTGQINGAIVHVEEAA